MQESITSGVSVIICCYNSAQRLPETIKHLALQKADASIAWEIIIVDNASTDDTATVAINEWAKFGMNIPLKVVDEPKSGLIFARQKGIQEANYSLLLFCDDDNHLESSYIQRSFELMEAMPEVGIIGGKSMPKLSFYPGKWIDAMYPALAINFAILKVGFVDWVFGAGMVIRRCIFADFDKNNVTFFLSGRKGNKQTFGEDIEICVFAKFLGYKVFLTDMLVFHHFIPNKRLKKSYFLKLCLLNLSPAIILAQYQFILKNKELSYNKFLSDFTRNLIIELFYFSPRILIGKNRFYSMIKVLQSIKLLLLLSLSSSRNHLAFKEIIQRKTLIKFNPANA